MSLFDTGLRPVVDKWLLDKSKEVRDYGDYWSASGAGYCQRKAIFERLGVPHVEKDSDARKQRVFTSGHLFHQWMQGITKEAGLSIAQELELQDEELMIRGHIDDLVLVEDRSKAVAVFENDIKTDNPANVYPDKLILYDYKTRNSKNFHFADNPSYFHKMQLGTYMYMLRANKVDWKAQKDKVSDIDDMKPRWELWSTEDLKEARTLNIEKDTLRMSEVQYLWSDELEKEVVDYWTSLNEHWKAKTLPKCTCADHENGFMSKPQWNPYYYADEPCSLEWYRQWKEANDKA